MPEVLKAKTAGLPRWAWLLMLTGAVGLGLYLRSQSVEGEEEGEFDDGVEGFEEGEGAGLATASLAGPAAGSITPVQSPFIPEGFTDIFAELSGVVGELGTVLGSYNELRTETEGLSGGGAPELPEEVHVPPPPPEPGPAPTAQPRCPKNVVNRIRKNRTEMSRLQNEINGLQRKIANLTNLIQRYPNAKKRAGWIRERNQARGSINHKRNKVKGLSAQNGKLRSRPGCGG